MQGEETHALRRLVRDLERRISGLLGREGTKLQRHRVASTEPTSAQVLTWNATTMQWEPTAAGAPSAHVIATTAGLGASHTTSGLTAGQVLRATGATTAAFQALSGTDIPHTVLDASSHSDTTAQTPTRGSLVYGNSTPKWDELALGQLGQFTRSDGTDIDWDGIRQNDVRGQGGPFLGHTRTESTMVQCGANQVNVFGPYKLLADTTVASGWAQLRITAGSGTCRMVIYLDDGGVPSAPSTLIDTSDEATITDTSGPGSWKEFPFTTTPPTLAAQTSYWVGLISNSSNIQMGMTSATASIRLVGDVGHRLDDGVAPGGVIAYPTPNNPFYDDSNTVRVGACYVEGIPLTHSTAHAGMGDVVGPASSTDTALALFDGTTGKLLKNSVVLCDASGNITGVAILTATGIATDSIVDKSGGDITVTPGTGAGTDWVIFNGSLDIDPDPIGNLYFRAYGALPGSSSAIILRRSGGAKASPTQALNTHVLGIHAFQGLSSTGNFASSATIRATATENCTTTTRGTEMAFHTTPNGTATLLERVKIQNDGDLEVVSGNIVMTGAGATVDGVDVGAHAVAADAHHAQSHTFDSHSDVPAITEAQGQVIYWNGSNWVALAPGTPGQFLKTQGAGANPIWDTAAGGGHTIRENGTDQTARTGLNFIDADAIVGTTLIADDAGGNETEVYMNLYALLTGRAGGQTLSGGSATNEILYLRGTSNGTPGTAHVEVMDGLTVAAGNITMSGAGATVDGVDVGAHHVATTGVHGAGANTLLHSASAAGGDATGTLGALVITDDSHGHTSTTVTTHSTAHANDHTQSHDHSAAGDGQNLLPTTITLPNVGGLHILDTDSSHDLVIQPGSNLTVDRILTLTTGDAARTLTLGGDTTLNGGTHSGTNTGDQTITLTGDVTGSGTGSFAATVGDNTHAHDSTTVTTHSTAHANDHVRSHDLEGASDHTTSSGVDGHFMRQTGATTFAFEADYYTINFIINGGGSAITTGVKGWVEVPGPGVLEEWRILLSAAENITVDIDYDTYANFPTVGNDLVAPSTTGVQKNEATGLSAAIPDKSILEFNVTGAPATAQMCTVALRIRKT